MGGSGKYEYYMSRWNPTFTEYLFLPPWAHWEDLNKPGVLGLLVFLRDDTALFVRILS